jgi:hypothetical protein
MVDHKLHEQHKKHLMTKCGFPFQVRHEGIFISVAATIPPHILVGDDLDFWEPKEKGCSKQRRDEIMDSSAGTVCRYLRRKANVRVLSISQAIAELTPPTPQIQTLIS